MYTLEKANDDVEIENVENEAIQKNKQEKVRKKDVG